MSNVKFGINQITLPTPASVNRWVRVLTITIAIFMAWMATASLIGPHSKDILNQILGLIMALLNGLAPLFGVQLTTNTVPSNEVAAIETHEK